MSSPTITVTDVAGNTSNAVSFSGIYQDTVTPTLTAAITNPGTSPVATPAGGNAWQTDWYNVASHAATITYGATDADATFAGVTTPDAYTFSDGTDLSSPTITVTDVAGNTSNAVSFSGIYQDTVTPTLTAAITNPGTSPVATPAGGNAWQTDWYNVASHAATITYGVTDADATFAGVTTPDAYTFSDGTDCRRPRSRSPTWPGTPPTRSASAASARTR